MAEGVAILAGNASRWLARAVARAAGVGLGPTATSASGSTRRSGRAADAWQRLHVVSMAPLIAEAIQRTRPPQLVGGRL